MQPTNSTQKPEIVNPLRTNRRGESIIFELNRHPIGMAFIYITLGVLLGLVAIIAVTATSLLPDFDEAMVRMVAMITLAVAVCAVILFATLARTIYYGNRWVLTTDSLTQISRLGLFNTQSSQLGLDNLEDVTVHQAGILSHVFNYGIIRCQTAGEYGKFLFSYCPSPNEYAQKLLMAREMFEHGPELEQHDTVTA